MKDAIWIYPDIIRGFPRNLQLVSPALTRAPNMKDMFESIGGKYRVCGFMN